MIKEKHCGGCDQQLPIDKFAKNKSAATGYQSRCKTCMKAKYDTRPKKKMHRDFEGKYKMRKYSRQEVLDHLQHLKDRESNPVTASRFDYSFLFTNPKLNK